MSSPISIDRVFGFYPMSIATSLAFEGLLRTGEHADIPGPSPIGEYGAILINIRTIFRNAFGSFEDKRDYLTPETLLTCIVEDVKAIMATAKAVAPSVLCVPYICMYKSANKEFPEAAFRNILGGPSPTPSQAFYVSLEQDVYRAILTNKPFEIEEFDVYPEGTHDTLILTQYPSDLLARKKFPKLALLESHTGRIKEPGEWFTKMNGKPEQIPFNKGFLVLFGDAHMFSPLDRKVRSVLVKTAEKYNWNQGTSMDRIYNCLRLVNEPHVIEFVRRLNR